MGQEKRTHFQTSHKPSDPFDVIVEQLVEWLHVGLSEFGVLQQHGGLVLAVRNASEDIRWPDIGLSSLRTSDPFSGLDSLENPIPPSFWAAEQRDK